MFNSGSKCMSSPVTFVTLAPVNAHQRFHINMRPQYTCTYDLSSTRSRRVPENGIRKIGMFRHVFAMFYNPSVYFLNSSVTSLLRIGFRSYTATFRMPLRECMRIHAERAGWQSFAHLLINDTERFPKLATFYRQPFCKASELQWTAGICHAGRETEPNQPTNPVQRMTEATTVFRTMDSCLVNIHLPSFLIFQMLKYV